MQSVFTHQWFVALLVVAVILSLVLAHRKKRKSQASSLVVAPDEEVADISEVRFAIFEVPAIRLLLGPSVATALLKRLATEVSHITGLARPPQIETDAILLAFFVDESIVLGRQIQKALSILSHTINIGGVQFCCGVNTTILKQGFLSEKESLSSGPDSCEDTSQFKLLKELRAAFDNGELALAYQPKLDLRTNQICSVEALLRWTRADGELANTADLIDLVEKTGTVKELTGWVLKRAIADGESFLAAGFPIPTFVNISGGLLADTDFSNILIAAVSDTCADIGIEITETAVIADPDVAIQNLRTISQAGIAIAIDDFGVGLSSLEYLQQLPASELKIDRNFIAKLSSSNRNPLIVRATIDLAHALEMRVTAEGVDDQLSVALLRVMGCDMAQGYLISPALPPLELIEYLNVHQAALLGSEPKKKRAKQQGRYIPLTIGLSQ
jgi:EAL domain-containing protein (putative c-di-GMP-specific phosphodiesterase class I)